MKFKGDLIITDPCYIVKSNDDWDICNYGENLKKLKIKTYISSGGADCVGNCVINVTTKQILGKFCSDSGMVSIMSLKELKRYNPDYMDELSEGCYTIIKDFKGSIQKVDIKNDENQYWAFIGEGNFTFRTDYVEHT